jgi:hypothetical protein
MSQSRVRISILILLVLLLHAVPVLDYKGHRQTTWPILTWAMYAKSLKPGPIETTKRRAIVSTSTGDSQVVTSHLIGLPRGALNHLFIAPMWRGDSSAAESLLHRLNRDRDDPFVAVTIDGTKYRLVHGAVVTEQLRPVTYRKNPSTTGVMP